MYRAFKIELKIIRNELSNRFGCFSNWNRNQTDRYPGMYNSFYL